MYCCTQKLCVSHNAHIKNILSEPFSNTVKYVWHTELDMLMKYKLCRNNEKIRQTKPIQLSNMLTRTDTQFDSEFSALALLQGERAFFYEYRK